MCGYCKTRLQNRWLLADDIFRQQGLPLADFQSAWERMNTMIKKFLVAIAALAIGLVLLFAALLAWPLKQRAMYTPPCMNWRCGMPI
jgi:hypothetical protein